MHGLSKAIMSEAGAWIARLNGPYRTRAAEQGFQRWLKDDPLHAEAFRLVASDWDGMEELKHFAHVKISAPTAEVGAGRPKIEIRRMRPVLAVAAIAVLAIVGGLFYYWQPAGIATGIGEQRILTLQDGTRVHLNTSTHIFVRYDKLQRRVGLQSGEALFEVAKQRNRPFIVTAGDRQVTALGTAFLVRRDRDRVAITLMEGKVSVVPLAAVETQERSKQAAGAVLAPGERLTFPTSDSEPALDRPQLEKLVAWQKGKLAIDNMRLSDAVAEMNRYSSVEILIEHPESGQLLISGVFSLGQSASFARAVAESYGLKIVEDENKIVLAGLAESPK